MPDIEEYIDPVELFFAGQRTADADCRPQLVGKFLRDLERFLPSDGNGTILFHPGSTGALTKSCCRIVESLNERATTMVRSCGWPIVVTPTTFTAGLIVFLASSFLSIDNIPRALFVHFTRNDGTLIYPPQIGALFINVIIFMNLGSRMLIEIYYVTVLLFMFILVS